MIEEIIKNLKPIRRAQLSDVIRATDGATIFIVLAGGFPASEVPQAALIALAQIKQPDRYETLKQLNHDDGQCLRVISRANFAHRNRKNSEIYDGNNAIYMTKRLVGHILSKAVVFERNISRVPEILNSFDIATLQQSRIRAYKQWEKIK